MRPRIFDVMVAGVLTVSTASLATAQGQDKPAIDVSAGITSFPDDGIVNEGSVGAAFRWHITPRVSVGPEFVHITGDSHGHQVLTGNVTFDLVTAARPGGVIPFVVVGGGFYRTSESFPGGTFSSTEGAFTAGGGLRYVATRRVSFGVDVRAGWEPHIRVTGLVSIGLGDRR